MIRILIGWLVLMPNDILDRIKLQWRKPFLHGLVDGFAHIVAVMPFAGLVLAIISWISFSPVIAMSVISYVVMFLVATLKEQITK